MISALGAKAPGYRHDFVEFPQGVPLGSRAPVAGIAGFSAYEQLMRLVACRVVASVCVACTRAKCSPCVYQDPLDAHELS